ncbi:unnamed protein product [Phytophthora fragariaefolia]|uniref:RxLR effector protein n=1 Tax=Phytophthora fragariaefolia TaxID=1490495 RepID=A0A9W6WKA5_9STRA|nr:unnamed protein product [Phytophthora fragariaefolia]
MHSVQPFALVVLQLHQVPGGCSCSSTRLGQAGPVSGVVRYGTGTCTRYRRVLAPGVAPPSRCRCTKTVGLASSAAVHFNFMVKGNMSGDAARIPCAPIHEAIAVTMDSNQAKISTVARGGSRQRFLRSYKKTVEDDSDDLDDLDEERVRTTALETLAKSWGYTYDDIVKRVVTLTDDQYRAWRHLLNKGVDASKKARRDAFNADWRRAHGIERPA